MGKREQVSSAYTFYLIAELVLLLVLIVFQRTSEYLLFYVVVAVMLYIFFRFLGRLLGKHGLLSSEKFMVVVAGPGAFLFIIEFLLFSYLYKYISIFAPSYFLIPFFLFTI